LTKNQNYYTFYTWHYQNKDDKFTYADYLDWPDDERWEIIDGGAFAMSPTPTVRHQKITGSLFNAFYNYLSGKPCQVFVAPVDVLLADDDAADDEISTVVQPDIIVVCDRNKILPQGIKGAPDIAVEVLSESTAYKDQTVKFALYQKHGVNEYWIVNPGARQVQVFRLNEQHRYGKPEFFTADDTITSTMLPGFACDGATLFAGDDE
jgi:Uma2 family endonuclease